MKCYFCGKEEKIVPSKRKLWNGVMVLQCTWCCNSLTKGLVIARERGFYDANSIGGGGSMVKVEKDATGGDFLKASYVKEHKISELVLVSGPSFAEFEKDGKVTRKLQFKINYEGFSDNKGMPDTWTLNSKSKNTLVDAWGEETDEWLGKKTPISLGGEGEMTHILVDALRIK
ncbi:hypothetical protein K0U27_00585 [archaeon]|nr:hypothetical protein [archaeon]